MHKFNKLFIFTSIFSMALFAVQIDITDDKVKLYNEIDQSYDIKNNWWWYEEEVEKVEKDPTITKHNPKKVKYQVSPFQKKQLDLLATMAAQNQKLLEQNQKIVEILEYNFPRKAPAFTINKKTGKKCVSNSSADCYVPLLTPEAQQVPVMATFLKKPNMENAKKYLQWQATYFNHMSDIGYGISYGYKQYGKKAYPTGSILGLANPNGKYTGDRDQVKHIVLKALAKNLTVYVFLGKTEWAEQKRNYMSILSLKRSVFKYFNNFTYVFLTHEAMDKAEKFMAPPVSKNNTDSFNSSIKIVNPRLFRENKIDFTPNIVVSYRYPSGEKISQKMSSIHHSDLVSEIYDFLVYNKIIDPANITEDKLIKVQEQLEYNGGVVEPDILNFKFNNDPSKSMFGEVKEVGKENE